MINLKEIMDGYLKNERTRIKYIGAKKSIPVYLMSIISINGTCINIGRKTEEVHEIFLEEGSIGKLIFVRTDAKIYFPDLKKKANNILTNSKNKDFLYIRRNAYLIPLLLIINSVEKIK